MFFFSFTANCCFMAILKPLQTQTRDKPLIDSLYKKSTLLRSTIINIYALSTFHTYLQKYDTTFEDPFFVSQSHTNAISLPLIYSISSKHVSEFSARKKRKKKPDTSGLIFPTTPRQRSNPHPREGVTNEIPHSPGTENGQMPGVCLGVGGC